MTCREVRSFFEDPLLVNRGPFEDCAKMSEHVGECPECNQFMEAQKELAVGLGLVHDSAPPFPASLDRAVLARYRNYIAQPKVPRPSATRRNPLRSVSVLAWAAALAAAMFVAREEILVFFPGDTTTLGADQSARPVAITAQLPATATPQEAARKHLRKRRSFSSRPKHWFETSSGAQDSVSPAFSSLLYCDQLSCDGAMEIIRVQLPSAALRWPQPASQPNVVSADVVVGSDGIARAIRIVE